jgi:hypothetical protein
MLAELPGIILRVLKIEMSPKDTGINSFIIISRSGLEAPLCVRGNILSG